MTATIIDIREELARAAARRQFQELTGLVEKHEAAIRADPIAAVREVQEHYGREIVRLRKIIQNAYRAIRPDTQVLAEAPMRPSTVTLDLANGALKAEKILEEGLYP